MLTPLAPLATAYSYCYYSDSSSYTDADSLYDKLTWPSYVSCASSRTTSSSPPFCHPTSSPFYYYSSPISLSNLLIKLTCSGGLSTPSIYTSFISGSASYPPASSSAPSPDLLGVRDSVGRLPNWGDTYCFAPSLPFDRGPMGMRESEIDNLPGDLNDSPTSLNLRVLIDSLLGWV